MNKTQLFLKRHSSTILTVMGATGVVGTAVLSVKATPKAMALLEEAKQEKGEDLTTIETIKVAWKPYIPAVVVGCSTIACIFGANILSIKNQASLMSAYALLDNAYKEYRNKAIELYGDEADHKIRGEIANSRLEEPIEIEDDNLTFFDYQSMRFFKSTMHHVAQAECAFKELLNEQGFACMNDLYRLLGIPPIKEGDQLGWFDTERVDPYGSEEFSLDFEKVTTEEGKEFWIIDSNMPPTIDYIL